MNIYDFDKTIYNGDSSVEFFKYAIKKNKKTILIIPKFSIHLVLYKLNIYSKEKLKSTFFSFVKYFDNIEELAYDFWKEKDYKLKPFYLKQKKENDIIISASPEFLLKPISEKYGFKLIATKVDTKTGNLLSKNCYGEEKKERLKCINIYKCNEFYSDSLSDEPLSKIAKRAFIVRNETIIPWDKI